MSVVGLFVLSALALPAADPQAFPRATPESQGIRSEAVMNLIDRLQAEGDMVHGYMLVRHGKVVAEGWWAPYDAETRLLELENGFGTQKIEIGANGVWKKGHAVMENDSTSTLDRMRGGWQPLGACGGWKDGSTFVARIAFTRSPFILDFTLDCSGEAMRVSCGCKFSKRYRFGSEEK